MGERSAGAGCFVGASSPTKPSKKHRLTRGYGALWPSGWLVASCFMRRRLALSPSVSDGETGQSLLMMKSISARRLGAVCCEAAVEG
jgi:hypothetical protein